LQTKGRLKSKKRDIIYQKQFQTRGYPKSCCHSCIKTKKKSCYF
jgi:hypothetical protein